MARADLQGVASALEPLARELLPGLDEASAVELEIHADGRSAALRDMAAFLDLTDRLYGRTDPKGLRSYAVRTHDSIGTKTLVHLKRLPPA